ncbi:MAG TPA: hypothetical protein VE173_02280 [Longimicrobiales bacterium]|nr:hypothetical protein [Longimicrobiales bacterium]
MSLIGFHRVLIGSAIIFCFGYAAWEIVRFWVVRGMGSLVIGVVFLGLGVLLSVYLKRLARFLGQEPK